LLRVAEDDLGIGPYYTFYEQVHVRHSQDHRKSRQFEALYVGRELVLLNESRARARREDAEEFVDFLRSGEFYGYFPQHADKPIVPLLSTVYIDGAVVDYLTHQGVYVLAAREGARTVLNLEAVRAGRGGQEDLGTRGRGDRISAGASGQSRRN